MAQFKCTCGYVQTVKDELIGKKAKCPRCKAVVEVLDDEPVRAEEVTEPLEYVAPARRVVQERPWYTQPVAIVAGIIAICLIGGGVFLAIHSTHTGDKTGTADQQAPAHASSVPHLSNPLPPVVPPITTAKPVAKVDDPPKPVVPKVEDPPKPVAPKVEDKPLVPELTLAKEYYFHGLKDRAKELLVNIVFASGSDKTVKAESLYLLGTISFEQGDHTTAFRDWERLCAEYPDTEQAREVKARLDQLKDVLSKITDSNISSVVAKSYLHNGDFWGKPAGIFTIDSSWLPEIELAVGWYDRVIAEYPKSDAAELAYTNKLFTLIGHEVERGQYGPVYNGATSRNEKEYGKYMPQLIDAFNSFEKAFPDSSSLQAFRFQIGQIYWSHDNFEETKTWMNKVVAAGGKTPTFYTEAAKARLNKLKKGDTTGTETP